MKLVGKVKDAHGLKGEMYILIFSKDVAWLNDLEFFELKDPNAKASLKLDVVNTKKFKDGLIVKASEVSDRTQAEKYKNWQFLIPDELLISEEGETIYLSEILNFTVVQEGKNLGLVKGFSSNGAQDLLIVSNGTTEFSLPFVDAFVLEVNHEKKVIDVNLPEGLIEINQEES